MDYQVGDAELDRYLVLANRLLTQKGKSPLTREMLAIGINQLKALVDICHHYGIAVILDVVYNHASGDVKGQPESIYFFDRAAGTNPNDSLYFTDQDHTGPVFAFWNQDVRQFLIDNAKFFIDEYHVDGFRYDQVTVIDKQNAGNGWLFCQHLNSTLDAQDRPPSTSPSTGVRSRPWCARRAKGALVSMPTGTTVCATRSAASSARPRADRARRGLAAGGEPASRTWLPRCVARGAVRGEPRRGVPRPRAAHSVTRGRRREHSDLVREEPLARRDRTRSSPLPGFRCSSWARSSMRTSAGLTTRRTIRVRFSYWDGLRHDKTMIDFHRFTRELMWLRRKHPALRGEGIRTISMENGPRVLVFQRWVEGVGRDVVVVASLNEYTLYGYQIPMPAPGQWFEVFNSDVYENWVNPAASGNGGSIQANGPGLNGLPSSAS